ncbi:MAG: hypothetical protein HQ446_12285 [Polaromonas sp.]|nr:hypothetical protein [Polaromonas sp.]
MAFGFFGFRKKTVIEDVEAKVPKPAAKSVPMTFDGALAAQAAALLADVQAEQEAPAPVAVAPLVTELAVDATEEAAPAAAVTMAEPAAEPAAEPEVAGQMGTMKATREDVIAAYKIFLGRLPESMEVVDPRVGVEPVALLVDFLASKEFLDQALKAQLVLMVAKKIIDARQKTAAATAAAATAAAATEEVKSAQPSPAVDPAPPVN